MRQSTPSRRLAHSAIALGNACQTAILPVSARGRHTVPLSNRSQKLSISPNASFRSPALSESVTKLVFYPQQWDET